jgi:formyl-CoA transferase
MAEIEGWTVQGEKREVMKAFAGRGIVCGAVLDTAEVPTDPRLRERETIFDLEHRTRGRFSVIGCPVRLRSPPNARL